MTFVNIGSGASHPKELGFIQASVATTAANGPIIPTGTRSLKIINKSSSVAYVGQGDATESPVNESNYYYIVPPEHLFIVDKDDILSGQLNLVLSSGTGVVDFVFSS